MMPVLDHCVTNSSEMTTFTKTLEVFDTYKHRDDKDSDEESFHLPLDDDEIDPNKCNEQQDSGKNGSTIETEEEILNKFINKSPTSYDPIDSQLEDHLLQDETEDKHKEKSETPKETTDIVQYNHDDGTDRKEENEISNENTKKEDVTKNEDLSEESTNKIVDDIDKDNKAAPADLEDTKTNKVKEDKENGGSDNKKENIKTPTNSEIGQYSDKCDNSNDSTKGDDTEDLFDISVIRDADEDNAENAYNEAHPEDNDEDGGDTKSNEDEEEEDLIDKQDEHLKNDEVDIEESNLKLDSDVGKDSGSDGEVDNSVESGKTKPSASVSDTFRNQDCKTNGDQGKDQGVQENSTISSDRSSLKRGMSGDDEGRETKKIRTDEKTDTSQEVQKPKEQLPLTSLISLSSFMKSKKLSKRLTMLDLEEFCLQKICEALVHKGDLGDILHQLKAQEQLIDSLRKEVQQLMKQARDLEIVNKKLMNDLKQHTTTHKPLSPLKITRSVGLQVKFTPIVENNIKKRTITTSPKALHVQLSKSPRALPNNVVASPLTTRQITTVPKQQPSPQPLQQQQSKIVSPILPHAVLQNRRTEITTNKTPTQHKNAKFSEVNKTTTTEPKSASVIDLTDEDDKRDKNKLLTNLNNNNTKIAVSKSITVPLRTTPVRVNATQGIRLTTSQGKGTPITTMVNSSAPQVMYVVQSSSQNGLSTSQGAKAVVFNLQTTNGVLTSALNGSAVSVIPTKQSNTIQLKTVAPAKTVTTTTTNKVVKHINKHPAPLPPPPLVRVSSDVALKPIPPKPHLTIRKTDTGIILQWRMPYELEMYEVIASYQLYAYQETSALPSTDMWRKVGDVKALALPMACTLTQFADKNKYYFAVRPVDIHKRIGMFSDPEEISL